MKLNIWDTLRGFVVGAALAASLFWWVTTHQQKTLTVACEEKVDRALANNALNNFSTLNIVRVNLASNSIARAKSVLSEHMLLELQSAWAVDRKYSNVLSQDLTILLKEVYPNLKGELDFSHFARWPTNTLAELKQFMKEADVLAGSNGLPPTKR